MPSVPARNRPIATRSSLAPRKRFSIFRISERPSVRAVRQATAGLLLLTAGVTLPAHAQGRAVPAGTTVDNVRRYDIPAGSLTSAINQLAAASDIYLIGSGDLTQGKTSAGLHGNYTVQGAFAALLSGTDLEAVPTASGRYALRRVSNAGGSAATLPEVSVVGAAIDPVAERVNPPTTVGSKIPLSQREIPQSVSVITQEQIKQQGSQSLDQVLKYAPGIDVFASDGQRFQYYARGFPINNFQIDGAPVFNNPNMSDTSSTSSPNLAMYDRVEVLRGPSGLYDGFGGPGGTINLVRKRAQKEFTASADVHGGTHGDNGAQLDVGGPLNAAGTVRGRIVGAYQDQDLTADSTWKRDRQVYGTLEADLTPDTLFRVGASYTETKEKDTWVGMPVYPDGTVPRRSKYFGADWNREEFFSTDVFAQLEQRLGSGWKLQATADYTYNDYHVLAAGAGLTDNDVDNTIGATNKRGLEHNQSYDVNVSGPFSMLGRTHHLTLGAVWQHMNQEAWTHYDPNGSSPVDINDIVYAKPAFPDANSELYYEKTTKYGIYGNARFSLADPLTLIVGGSVNWWRDHDWMGKYNVYDWELSQGKYPHKVIPYAGLVYDLNKTYSVYTSYTKIFEPQNVPARGGNILTPITGEQYEVGIKGEYLDGRLNASLAAFQVTERNRSMMDPTDPTYTYYILQGKARARGFETQVSGELTPGWTMQAGYTFTNSQVWGEGTDMAAYSFNQIAPKHLFKLWTNYRLPGDLNKWQVGAGVNAQSATYSSTIRQGGFYTADARIAYQATSKLSFALNATNLFDRHYFASLGGVNNVYWGTPRRIVLSMHVQY